MREDFKKTKQKKKQKTSGAKTKFEVVMEVL